MNYILCNQYFFMNIIITFSLLAQLLAHPIIGILTIPSDADYTDYPST